MLRIGHRRTSTINRYIHLDDATLGQGAEQLAKAIEWKLWVIQWLPMGIVDTAMMGNSGTIQ